jgi:hypothetical protein
MLGKNIASSLPAIADYGLGKKQEPRADLKIGALSIVQIDVEANLVVLQAETDHAAMLNKVVGFADGEDGGTVQAGQNCGRSLLVTACNEKEMTAPGIFVLLKMANLQGTRADLLALNGVFEDAGERIFSHGTEDEGTIPGAERVHGPIHELRKMENESSLQLIFTGTGLRVGGNQGERMKEQNNKEEDSTQGEGRQPRSANLEEGLSP